MSNAATEPPAALQPDPDRAVPPRIGQALGLVRTLIAHGKNFADALRRRATDPHLLPRFAVLATIFATTDLTLILARITRGLLRAAALEARLSRRAARGQDLTPTPFRLPSPRKPRKAPASTLARPTTTEEILAQDRHRPIGVVLVGICLDLGIMPGHLDRATWDGLSRHIIEYGGSLAKLVSLRERGRHSADPAKCVEQKTTDSIPEHSAAQESPSPGASPQVGPIAERTMTAVPAWAAPSWQSPAPACTGPP